MMFGLTQSFTVIKQITRTKAPVARERTKERTIERTNERARGRENAQKAEEYDDEEYTQSKTI